MNEEIKIESIVEEIESIEKEETKQEIVDKKAKKQPKPKIMNTEDEGISYKAERLFAKNWFIIAIFSISVSFYALYVSGQVSKSLNELKDEVRSNNLHTVFTTVDGRAIKVQKTKVEPKYIEKWLAKTLVDNLIVSRAELTDNYRITSFGSAGDVIKNSAKLQFIYNDMMDKNNKESQKYLRTYLLELQKYMAENKLPEVIQINKYNIESFTYINNKFTIKINANLLTVNYDISTDEKYEKTGVVPIEFSGYVDLTKSTELNPYGLIMDSFRIGILSKERRN